MKRVVFKAPYRVGRKSGTTVLDANGIEVTNFRNEKMAEDYVKFLNNKEFKYIAGIDPISNNKGSVNIAKVYESGIIEYPQRKVYVAGIDPFKMDNPFKKFKRKIMFKLARFFNKKIKQ